MKPLYLRQTTTGDCFAYTDRLMERNDMVEWTGPLPWEATRPAIIIPEAVVAPAVAPTVTPAEPTAPKPYEKKTYPCTLCDFVGKNSGALRLHMRKHAKE